MWKESTAQVELNKNKNFRLMRFEYIRSCAITYYSDNFSYAGAPLCVLMLELYPIYSLFMFVIVDHVSLRYMCVHVWLS